MSAQPSMKALVAQLLAERDEARAALARVQALHCECTTGNCACGGGPGWCHGCDESWPCSTARALAVPEPPQDKPGFVHTLSSGLAETGLPDELPSDLAAEVDRQLDAIDEAKARAAASAANYMIRGVVPEPKDSK